MYLLSGVSKRAGSYFDTSGAEVETMTVVCTIISCTEAEARTMAMKGNGPLDYRHEGAVRGSFGRDELLLRVVPERRSTRAESAVPGRELP